MKKLLIILATLALLLSACTTTDDTIKLGSVYTLSGDYVDFLHGNVNGVRMAVEDFQAETGIKVNHIEEDDKSCTEKTTGANKLINLDQVDAIVGTTCSSMTLSMAPLAEESQTVLISGVSTSADVTNAGEYVFRTISSDASKSKAVAKTINDAEFTKVAIIYSNDNDATLTNVEGIKDNLVKEIVVDEPSIDLETDFRTALLKVKESEADVLILVYGSPASYGNILNQMKELGIDVPVYVPQETIENQEVIDLAGENAEGVLYPYFVPASGAKYDDFVTRYQAKYGEDVPTYTVESYDATMIALKAIAASDGTKEDILAKVKEIGSNYEGVSGTVKFDENGDVTMPIAFKTIKDGKFVWLE